MNVSYHVQDSHKGVGELGAPIEVQQAFLVVGVNQDVPQDLGGAGKKVRGRSSIEHPFLRRVVGTHLYSTILNPSPS